MYLTIYTSDLVAVGAVDVYASVVWVRKDTEYGTFTITASATDNNLRFLKERNIVQKGSDLEVGYINSVAISSNRTKNDTIIAKGYFYCNILGQRDVLVNANNLKSLIENNLRGLDLISVDANVASITFSNDFIGEKLTECITALAKANGFGFKTLLNRATGKIDFSIYYGVDRSVNQSENPYVIFSDNYQNLQSADYTYSEAGVVNTVYARCKLPAGIKSCVPPTYDIVGGTGLNSFEKYITVDAITYDQEFPLPGGESVTKTFLDLQKTLTEMEAKAKEQLVAIQENFQGTVDFKLKYRMAYDLGDIVTVRKEKWKKTVVQRITEVTEIYDHTEDSITPTFGNPARTILDILKKVK